MSDTVQSKTVVLSALFTQHRDTAGSTPLYPAAYLCFHFYFTSQSLENQACFFILRDMIAKGSLSGEKAPFCAFGIIGSFALCVSST